ncbi:MAG TPA: recombinase family protein [Solirubrobacteraceae bacterium]|nr:recombinase family protein [Solirubrobacteraceae bacterium]
MPTLEHEPVKISWEIIQERAISEGKQVGPTPFGYERQDGVLVPDDDERLLVQRAYELAASQGVAAATRYLERYASGARFWTTATVRRMLAKRTYLGEVRTGAIVNAHAHEPLVDRATWRAAQHKPGAYTPPCEYPLSGIAHCASCGQAMVAGPKSSTGRRMYRCVGAQTLAKARCLRPASIVADRLEQYVRAQAERLDAHVGPRGGIVDGRRPDGVAAATVPDRGLAGVGARRVISRTPALSSLVVEVSPGRGSLGQRVSVGLS